MEGATVRTDISPCSVPALDGTGTPQTLLENATTVPRCRDCNLARFLQSPPEIKEVFRWLKDAGLKLKPTKSELLQNKVHYLGHVVSANPAKVEAIKKWEPHKDVKELQAFLGTAGYYR